MTAPAYGPDRWRLTPDEARAMMQAYIEHKSWWVIPIIAHAAGPFVDALEEFVGPWGIIYLARQGALAAFVHKRDCSPDDMARLLNSHLDGHHISPEQLETQSIILIGDR